MSSRCPELLLCLLALAAPAWADEARQLRVCADPDNLPYSHADGSGFENRIAALLAADLHAELQYEWLPQRRGFVRKTMGAGLCDVFIGVPAGFERVLTTKPYYRSSYVFVYRSGEPAPSLADPAIKRARVGVQLIGDDFAATPPGHALTRAGAIANVVGYTVYGDGPAAGRIVDALSRRELDTALVWGPQAGWFASRAPVPMTVAVASAPAGLPAPFELAIAMGVKRGNAALRDELDAAIARHRREIDAILAAYHVPRTDRKEQP